MLYTSSTAYIVMDDLPSELLFDVTHTIPPSGETLKTTFYQIDLVNSKAKSLQRPKKGFRQNHVSKQSKVTTI